jgi:hypothetical protein
MQLGFHHRLEAARSQHALLQGEPNASEKFRSQGFGTNRPVGGSTNRRRLSQ